jgi:hypothetical protein
MTKLLFALWISCPSLWYLGLKHGETLDRLADEHLSEGVELAIFLYMMATPYIFFATTIALGAKFGAMPLIGWLLNTKK